MKSIIKKLLYYFTVVCFLFTGTVVPVLMGMRVFADDIDAVEYVDSVASDDPVMPIVVEMPKEISNALDSVTIVKNDNTNNELFEWNYENNRTRLSLDKVNEASSWRLNAEWSIKDTAEARDGDYFTIEIPEGGIFDPAYLSGSGVIKNTKGDLIATYEILTKSGGKEIKITLTDYVEGYNDIQGDFWCVLFVGYVDVTTFKTIQFIVNGGITVISGDIEVIGRPYEPHYPTSDYAKWVNSGPTMKITDTVTGKDYYYFSWILVVNLTFGVVDNFYFEDEIKQNSPHIFVTGNTLNCGNGTTITLSDDDYAKLSKTAIHEYIAADKAADEETKRQIYFEHYNNGYFMHATKTYNYPLQNEGAYPGYSLASESSGIPGIVVSGYELDAKRMSANLGRVTRPMYIQYYTIATQEFTEDDLVTGSATANTISNTFYPMERIIQSEKIYGFQANHGGSANGITGGLSFSFQKITSAGEPLEGAWFGLFTASDCPGTPLRKAMSNANGTVTFDNITASEYYIKETSPPTGYMLSDTVYMVIVDSGGCKIYDGVDFTRELADKAIVNDLETTLSPPEAPAKITISGTKMWADGDNVNRPESITVHLLQDGTKIDSITVSEPWTYEFNDLPEYDSDTNEPYIYTVREDEIVGYTPAYNDGINYDIINTLINIDIIVNKVWVDGENQDGVRPDSVTVKLLANGKEEGEAVTLDANNDWSYTWEGLPEYKYGEKITYTVTETPVNGYSASYSNNDNIYTVTNSYTPGKTRKTVLKVWNDADDRDRLRPDSICVQLYEDGGFTHGSPVTLNADNNWRYTWEGLPEKSNGKAIVYTAREITEVSGYVATYSEDTFIITNKHTVVIPITPTIPITITTDTQDVPETQSSSTAIPPDSSTPAATSDDQIFTSSPDSTTPSTSADTTEPTENPSLSITTTPTLPTPTESSTLIESPTTAEFSETEPSIIPTTNEIAVTTDKPDVLIFETTEHHASDSDVHIPAPQTGDIAIPIILSVMSLTMFAFLIIAKKRAWVRF